MKPTTPPAQSKKSRNKYPYPALGFSEAMALPLPTEQGERQHTVSSASEADFLAFIDSCLRAFAQSEKASESILSACMDELAGLDYAEPVARWYALLVLREYGVALAPFEKEPGEVK